MEQESGEIIVPIDAPSTLTNLRRVTSGRTSVLTGVEKRREAPGIVTYFQGGLLLLLFLFRKSRVNSDPLVTHNKPVNKFNFLIDKKGR